jgi:hypothetical protein
VGVAVQVKEQLAVSVKVDVEPVMPPLAAPNWVMVNTVLAPGVVLPAESMGGVEVLVTLLDEAEVALTDVETPKV